MPQEIPTTYDQKQEPEIYKRWEDSGYFNPDNLQGEPFTIIMPPSNANGHVHVGHALGFTLQDIMIRYQRMQGKKTLWLPGTDHAGFETQVVFEKKLEKEGRSRFQMTREEFYKEVWDFVQEYKLKTEEGIRRLGASCDWSRNTFTLDPKIVEIVYATFKQMFNDGLIYRGNRISNWCPKHQTGLADLETKYEERTEPFYFFKYGPFMIGTSRPETKFGDKYVVMHPKDKRYAQYEEGQQIQAEWINGPITATVIKDEAVDMEFGTGVMTITPAHDAVDFDIAKRHNLDIEQIIDKRGKLLPIAQEFGGMKILEARPKIVEKLKAKGLLEKIDENYKHNVQLCYKCNNLIEPQIIPQWYVAMTKATPSGKSLRDMAVDAVKSGQVKINPEAKEKIFMHWMENIVDWPISRQIWWGIPIPVWYKTEVGSEMEAVHFEQKILYKKLGLKNEAEFNAFSNNFLLNEKQKISWGTIQGDTMQLYIGYVNLLKEREYLNDAWVEQNRIPRPQREAKMHIGEKPPEEIGWYQDPDTFDTWFSSGQWPYAALMAHGKKDFETFYPTQVMETGWDIIFFWVARMIMFGLYKTGKVPFENVYLHGLVRDKDRQKMSKSKGNVVDPLGVIDQFGIDALRMALTVNNLPGNDLPLSEDKVRGYRNFANKIWNASRFVIQNTEGMDSGAKILPEDQKLLNEVSNLARSLTAKMDKYDLAHASEDLYHYFWHTFADKTIETSKARLANPETKSSTQRMLAESLETLLKLLHPFVPFVTEAVWQINHKDLLMIQNWPNKK